ncbi:MAG: hypothetical protein GY749_02430 [Desulfobacteraceae bacterium]|nr:hypothetical protein [Desulfobacteraceae bacterium]
MKTKYSVSVISALFLFVFSILISADHAAAANWTEMISPTSNALRCVWGSDVWRRSSNDVFAVGDSGTILHYNGVDWTEMSCPVSNDLKGVWGTSGNNVFAVGDSGIILHYNGTEWTEMSSPVSEELRGIWGSSGSNVFAVGMGGVIVRYDGTAWTLMDRMSTANLWSIWGYSANHIFAVGDSGTILYYDGSDWTHLMNIPNIFLRGVWGSSEEDAFAVGSFGALYQYDDGSWTKIEGGSSANHYVGIWGNSENDTFVVISIGDIVHYDGTTWSSMGVGSENPLQSVWGSSSTDVFAVGGGGKIFHYSPQDVPILSVTPPFQDVPATEGSAIFDVTNTGEGTMVWTAGSDAEWLTVVSSQESGKITATYTANPTDSSRIGKITVTAPNATGSPKTVEVRQAEPGPVLSVTPSFTEVSAEKGSTSFNIANTGVGTLEWAAESKADWIVIDSDNIGTGAAVITLSYEANTATDSRTGAINIIAPEAAGSPQIFEIRQSYPVPILTVAPALQEVSETGGSTTFDVTNTGVGTLIWTAESNTDWIVIDSGDSGTGNGTITATYESNLGSARTGTITITAESATGSPKTVEVKQSSVHPVLTVTPIIRELTEAGGSATFDVANSGTGILEWTTESDADWISIVQSSGVNSGTITVSYEPNTGAPRAGTITVTAPGAAHSPRTVDLRQNPVCWQTMESGGSYNLRDVWGSTENNVFAVGKNGAIIHYDGSAWGEMASGSYNYLRAVWGSSGNNVFAVGQGGVILHYNGTLWTEMESGVTEDLRDVWGSSGNNVFAVGEKGVILRYNGISWIKAQPVTLNSLNSVWGSSENDVFAAGGIWGTVTMLHYDGEKWTQMQADSINIPYDIWGSSGNNAFAAGNSGSVLHYTGGTWKEMATNASQYLQGIWGSSGKDVFAVGMEGTILRYNGSDWTELVTGVSKDLYGVWGSSENDVFAVGNSGTIIHYSPYAGLPGDVDGNGVVNLGDAVLALKVTAGIDTGAVNLKADVNGDAGIGTEEVSYILRIVLFADKSGG